MDSWEGRWHRWGEMLIAVGVPSGIIWTATIAASPSAKVSIWPADVVCGFIVLLGIYFLVAPSVSRLWLPGRDTAVMAQSRHHPGYLGHLADQQSFAQACDDSLYRSWNHTRIPQDLLIDMSSVKAEDFRRHFPNQARLMDDWNAELSERWRADERARNLITEAHQRIDPTAPPILSQFLSGVAKDDSDFSSKTLQWSVVSAGGDGVHRLLVAPSTSSWLTLQLNLPSDEAEAMGLIMRVAKEVSTLDESEEIKNWRVLTARVADLRVLVEETLETVTRTHNLDGRCDRCP